MSGQVDEFFVGYDQNLPVRLRGFLRVLVAIIAICSAALALLLGTHQGDGGDGGFDWNAGPKQISGILETAPYPLIHVPRSADFPEGHTYLLSGDGKRNVAPVNNGDTVAASGFVVKRGTLDMLVVSDDRDLKPVTTRLSKPKHVDLGRWRVQGEICDGKCYAGAMKPGTGLAHKACANLCLLGGIPPVLVTSSPVAGTSYFLLGDADGNALDKRILEYVAVLIQAEGRIERRGDLNVFKIDTSTLKVVQH